MLKQRGKLNVDMLPDQSRLLMAYIGALSSGMPPYLNGFSASDDFWAGRWSAVEKGDRGPSWTAVVDDIAARSKKLGANDELLGRLGKAKKGEAFFVVTGQQPGTLGGPLHTVYKIATAVALADALGSRVGVPGVPLYWSGGDDADFSEIRDLLLLAHPLSPISASIAQEAHHSGMPIGDISTDAVASLWQGLQPFVAELGGFSFVRGVVNEALDTVADHGELSASILVRLFAGRLAVVDGRSGVVRRHAQQIFSEYVENEAEIKAKVAERGKRLEAAGYHAQLTVGADSGVFVVEGGRRKSVAPERRDALVDAVKNRVESCSPGVVVRNLVQDFTFKPLAVVLGPAEIAYRAQIGEVYRQVGVARPVDFPRLGGTLVPTEIDGLISGGDDIAALLREPAAFAKDIYRRSVPDDLERSSAELKIKVNEMIDRFLSENEAVMSLKAQGKIRGRFAEVKSRMENAAGSVLESGRTSALARWPFLSEIEQVMRPSGKAQERSLSGLQPFLYGGEGVGLDLIRFAAAYVDELLDGRATHIVYSPK